MHVLQDFLTLLRAAPGENGVHRIHKAVQMHEARQQEGQRGDPGGGQHRRQQPSSQRAQRQPQCADDHTHAGQTGGHQAARVLVPGFAGHGQRAEHAQTHDEGVENLHGVSPL